LLQGILSHADNHTLAFTSAQNEDVINLYSSAFKTCHGASHQSAEEDKSNDECSSACFLLQLLPAIKQLCISAKFKYHAFRLLELWIGRLKSLYQDNSEDVRLANECLVSVENDLLELLVGHMDCSVDGVTELIGCVLDNVMQLDKLLNQHTSK